MDEVTEMDGVTTTSVAAAAAASADSWRWEDDAAVVVGSP